MLLLPAPRKAPLRRLAALGPQATQEQAQGALVGTLGAFLLPAPRKAPLRRLAALWPQATQEQAQGALVGTLGALEATLGALGQMSKYQRVLSMYVYPRYHVREFL